TLYKEHPQELEFNCPYCLDKHHLHVNKTKPIFRCVKCEESGGIGELAKFLDIETTKGKPNVSTNGTPPGVKHSKFEFHFTDEAGEKKHIEYRTETEKGKRISQGYFLNGSIVYKKPPEFQTYIYELPAVIEAKNVILVEGCKKAFLINNLLKQTDFFFFFVATTNPQGAGKWKDEYSEYFNSEQTVYIFPDPDKEGYKHANQVYFSLKGKVKEIRFPKLSEKAIVKAGKSKLYDIADFIEQKELGKEGFLKLLEQTPPGTPEFIGEELLPIKEKAERKASIIEDIIKDEMFKLYDMKYNVITCRYEYKTKQAEKFIELTDRDFNSVFFNVKRVIGDNVRHSQLLRIVESDYVTSYNPIENYFSALPKWEPTQKDYIKELSSFVESKDILELNNKQFSKFHYFLKKWLTGAVACGLHNKKNETIFVLIGSQGTGKTTFLNSLFDPAYIHSGSNFDPSKEEHLFYLSDKFLINLDELANFNKVDMEHIKGCLSMTNITGRRKYARRPETYPRRASLCGSTNDENFIGDETGTRRYLPVKIDRINFDKITPELIAGVWSQARYLFEQGFKYWVTSEEQSILEKLNEPYKIQSPEEELLLKYFTYSSSPEFGFYTNSEIITYISETSKSPLRLTPKKMGMVLKRLEFERIKHSSRQIWGYLCKTIS
ncbi:MAG: hypothetical protein KDK45_22200, partial [Leptospiraceae bacterium]|nr:hypothetical protein [Leptospiraceae bacterium]